MSRFRLRFVGRFVFACEAEENGEERGPVQSVTVLAARMNFNADLDCRPHRLLLAAPRSHVQTLGTRPANLTTFGITENHDAREQISVWEIDGHDVIPLVAPAAITLTDWVKMRDIRVLQLGEPPPPPTATFNQNLLPTTKIPDAAVTAVVSGRFTFLAGSFTCYKFAAAKLVSFEPLHHEKPDAEPGTELADVVDVDLEIQQEVSLQLRRHSDGAVSTIVIRPLLASDRFAPVVVISNLCTRESRLHDPEFAAYYDLLVDPPRGRDRLIPYEKVTPVQGGDSACTGCGTTFFQRATPDATRDNANVDKRKHGKRNLASHRSQPGRP